MSSPTHTLPCHHPVTHKRDQHLLDMLHDFIHLDPFSFPVYDAFLGEVHHILEHHLETHRPLPPYLVTALVNSIFSLNDNHPRDNQVLSLRRFTRSRAKDMECDLGTFLVRMVGWKDEVEAATLAEPIPDWFAVAVVVGSLKGFEDVDGGQMYPALRALWEREEMSWGRLMLLVGWMTGILEVVRRREGVEMNFVIGGVEMEEESKEEKSKEEKIKEEKIE